MSGVLIFTQISLHTQQNRVAWIHIFYLLLLSFLATDNIQNYGLCMYEDGW